MVSTPSLERDLAGRGFTPEGRGEREPVAPNAAPDGGDDPARDDGPPPASDAHGLPLPDDAEASHPKVVELREAMLWSEGQVWTSPERHGAMSAVMKAQIDWIPLSVGAVRPTQGRTLAVMQVSGGSQSFNAVNALRLLGRWMRMITIPNQSSVPMAYKEFDDAGRMKPGPLYDRVVDVCEELMKFTLLTRERADYLVDRYSERKEREPERLRDVANDIGFVKR